MVKRFLYVVALAFLFQLSWGTASAYCMHEADQTSQHFGHHHHQHQKGDGDAAESGKAPVKKAGAHPDCATCAHAASYIAECSSEMPQLLLSSHQAMIPFAGQAAPYLGLPERPQWPHAALSGARSC